MSGELVAGAALGALLGELLKGVIHLMENAINFKAELEKIKSQVEFLIPLMKQVDEVGDDFRLLYSKTMKQIIDKGTQLIIECDAAATKSVFKYHKIPSYTKKLRKLDAELERASRNLSLQLMVQQTKKLQQALQINNNRCARTRTRAQLLASKIVNKIFMGGGNYNNDCSCGIHNYQITTKLPLLFYHDKRLKGKTGADFVDAWVGRAVEHIKNDPKEGVEGKIEEKIKKWGEVRFEKIFHRTFETTIVGAADEEKLQIWFACHLSITITEEHKNKTIAALGVLFVSSAKIAFCSLKHSDHTKSLYLKVVIPFELLKGIGFDDEQKYIQLISIDDQEFRFMNFRNYNDAQKWMQQVDPVRAPICTRCVQTLSSLA